MVPFLTFMLKILRTFALEFKGSTPLLRIREGKSESGRRELALALFYCLTLKPTKMIVKLLRDNGCNPFKNAILSQCLLERGSISINAPYAYIMVPEWAVFCKCVLRAAAECSRDGRGVHFEHGFNVRVLHDNGHEYVVHIWIDANLNGLRYGSISE
jgi:hypothetical protein